jgi:hypothetical protein
LVPVLRVVYGDRTVSDGSRMPNITTMSVGVDGDTVDTARHQRADAGD